MDSLFWQVTAVALLYEENTKYCKIKRETESHGDDDPRIM